MRISLQALETGSVNSISILVAIGGKQATALVDSGSNATFMSLQFPLQTDCNILIKDTTRNVTVARQGKLWSGSYIPTTTFTTRGVQFQHAFKVLDLPGHDIVLGSDWLAKHGPVSFHYSPRQLSIVKDGITPITIPACEPLSAATEIDHLTLNRLLLSGSSGFL